MSTNLAPWHKPLFTRAHYQWLASLVAALPRSDADMPALCDGEAAHGWTCGRRHLKRDLIEALAAKLALDNLNFDPDTFRKACNHAQK